MENKVFFIILFATIMHAIWNAMVKKHPDKTVAVSGIVLGHIPLALIAIIVFPMPSVESIPYIIVSAIIHQGYQWYLLLFIINTNKIGKTKVKIVTTINKIPSSE